MNKVYRIVYNHATQTWTAVQEHAKGHGKYSTVNKSAAVTSVGGFVRFAYTLIMSGILFATGQVAYGAVVAKHGSGTGGADTLGTIVITTDSGSTSDALGRDSAAIGTNASTQGQSAIAVGSNTKAVGTNAFALGNQAETKANNATAIGTNAQALAGAAVAMGQFAKAEAEWTIAIGQNATAMGNQDIAIGRQAGVDNGDYGVNTSISRTNKTGIYYTDGVLAATPVSQVLSGSNISIGREAGRAGAGANNIAMGNQAGINHQGERSVTIGYDANNFANKTINGKNIGNTIVRARETVAIGDGAMTYGEKSVAIGDDAQVYHQSNNGGAAVNRSERAVAIGASSRSGGGLQR